MSQTVALFSLPIDAYAVTSDDCYTPRWVFDAMALHFDLDVAAPPGGPWHVPCDRYYTAADDGLAQPWDGLVWCNPPYSNFWPWADRWSTCDSAILMGSWMKARWNRLITRSATCVVFLSHIEFSRPESEPVERLAAADPYGAVLYGKPLGEEAS